MTRAGPPRVLADGWFSWLGGGGTEDGWVVFTSALAGRLPDRLAAAILGRGVWRGIALGLLSAHYDAVAMNRHDPGWRTVLMLRAVLGRRRKLVVLHFFDHAPSGRWGRLWRRLDRWAVRRSLLVAQVLTPAEFDTYPGTYGLPGRRFALIRFAARTTPRGAPAPTPREHGPVVAAGRAHCDWQTLFRAAAGRGWDLRVVCSALDHARVQRLNLASGADAQISCELPADATRALLASAVISIVPLTPGLVGRGHIRLAEATDAGAAIVASDVASLVGYVDDGRTAVLVAPGDADALRAGVEALLEDPRRRVHLAQEAFSAAAGWTGADYVDAIHQLASEAAAHA